MSPALSLEASAEAYLACGLEVDAAFCRRMAGDCRALGPIGEALYRHWASEQAQRASAKLAERKAA